MGKLAASLPGESGRKAGRIRERLLVDSAAWGRRGSAPTHLRAVQDAVFGDRRLHLRYRRAEAYLVKRTVEPLGLILKAGVWYLLALVDDSQRTFRLSRVEAAEILEEPARRPAGFDLAQAWRSQTGRWDAGRTGCQVTVRAEGENRGLLLRVAGDRVADVDVQGLVHFEFPALGPAAAFLASFGSRVEAVAPSELRAQLAGLGGELTTLYAD